MKLTNHEALQMLRIVMRWHKLGGVNDAKTLASVNFILLDVKSTRRKRGSPKHQGS